MEQCGLIGSIFSPNASEQEQAFRTTGAYVKLCKHRINRQVRVSPGKLIGTQQSGHLMIINTFFYILLFVKSHIVRNQLHSRMDFKKV